MRWGNPQALWLLLLLPGALIAFFWWAWRERQRLTLQFIQARLLPNLTTGVSPGREKLRFACIVLAVVFLILALARPQWGFQWEEVKQRGLDIVVAIDTSKSMLAEDVKPSRLARAKLAALDLMRLAKSDRLGLVAFAGAAFLQCPLTIDDSAFHQSVESLDVNIIPQGGTALADAIETAETAFKEGDNYKVLVILTDGEDHDSGAVEAAKAASKKDMQIFTIGIGTPEGELLQITDAKGRTDYIRDDQGNVVKSHLNEALLREIAGATSRGFYLPMRGAKTIDNLYAEGLAPLPKSESGEKLVRRYHERFHWPLALAILCLIVETVLPEEPKSKRSPGAPASLPAKERGIHSASSTAVPGTLILLLFLLLPGLASASPSKALDEYRAGKYDQALKDYEDALVKHKEDPRLHYNAGAAAYRAKQYDQAQKQFNDALNSQDLNLQGQAYYNLGNTLFNLGQADAEPDKKQKLWEESVQDFDNALKLNPNDGDAKFNRDFVTRLLEELKKQQQQQKNQNDKNKNQKDPKDQQNQNNNQQQNNQNQDKKDQSQQDKDKQDQEKPDQNKNDQQSNPDKKQQQDQAANKDDKKDQQQQQAQNQPKSEDQNQNPDEQQAEQARAAAGEMTKQQAEQLLNAQKGHEMVIPIKPETKKRVQLGPIKDW